MTGRREVSWNRRIAQDSATAPPARDLARLQEVERRTVQSLRGALRGRVFWPGHSPHAVRWYRHHVRNQVAEIRALRFAIEVLS